MQYTVIQKIHTYTKMNLSTVKWACETKPHLQNCHIAHYWISEYQKKTKRNLDRADPTDRKCSSGSMPFAIGVERNGSRNVVTNSCTLFSARLYAAPTRWSHSLNAQLLCYSMSPTMTTKLIKVAIFTVHPLWLCPSRALHNMCTKCLIKQMLSKNIFGQL